MASAPVIAVLFLLAASAAAAQQDTLSSGTFSFNFSDTKWGGELEQPARLAVISKLNSTVQSQQGDPLKLGALLLESIRFNQTEAVLRSFGEAIAAVNSTSQDAYKNYTQLGRAAAYATLFADKDATEYTRNGTLRPPTVRRSDILRFPDTPLVNVSKGLLGRKIPAVFFAALISSTPKCWNVGSVFGPNTFSTEDGYVLRCGGQIGPVLSAYVRELVKLVPGTGFITSLFEVQDALDDELATGSTAAKILNRCLQVYGSGNGTINALYTSPNTPSSD